SVRRIADGACADVGPCVTTCHCGRRPSLIEENQPATKVLLARRHVSRRSATSGRSCSLARTVFFEADPLGGEKARQHRLVGFHAVSAKQTLGDRIER